MSTVVVIGALRKLASDNMVSMKLSSVCADLRFIVGRGGCYEVSLYRHADSLSRGFVATSSAFIHCFIVNVSCFGSSFCVYFVYCLFRCSIACDCGEGMCVDDATCLLVYTL